MLGFLPSNAVGLCMTDFTVSIGSGEGSCKFFFPRFEKISFMSSASSSPMLQFFGRFPKKNLSVFHCPSEVLKV